MAEQYLIRLGRGYNGFFCPESRFHLIGGAKPQDVWPAAAPFTQAVKVGLRSGTLKDAKGTIPIEAYASKRQLAALALEQGKLQAPVAPAATVQTPDAPQAPVAPAGDTTPPAADTTNGDTLTEAQIDEMGKKELLAFIAEKEIDKDTLDLNSRSTEEDIKNALKIHFGHKMV